MKANIWRTPLVAVLTLAITNVGFVTTAQAGLIGTSDIVRSDRAAQLESIKSQLQRADVRAELAKLGVDEAALDERLDNLSDGELAAMSKQMQDAPAGGILALIGATFVVLLVLEWIGVIDVFKKTPSR